MYRPVLIVGPYLGTKECLDNLLQKFPVSGDLFAGKCCSFCVRIGLWWGEISRLNCVFCVYQTLNYDTGGAIIINNCVMTASRNYPTADLKLDTGSELH